MAENRFDKQRFAKLMNQRGFNDYTLAAETGLSRTAIYYLRIGKRTTPAAETVKLLAEGLGASIEELMGDEAPESGASRLPAAIQQLVDIAGNLSEVTVEELTRIAIALQKLEQEQQTLRAPMVAAMVELHDRLVEQGVDKGTLDILESLIPPPRKLRNRRRGKNAHKPGEQDSEM